MTAAVVWLTLKLLLIVFAVVSVYVLARLIFSAWFRSKWEWELTPKYPQSDMVDVARRACNYVFKKPKAKRRN